MATMRHTVFGHFENAEQARAAYAQLRRGQMWRTDMSIHVRTPGKNHEELPLSLTDARGAILRGIVLSGIVGFVSLALLVAVGSRWLGFSPTYAFFGGFGGMLLGALAGLLQGSGQPHPDLLKMEEQGGVLLVVKTTDEDDLHWAEGVMRGLAARVEAPLPAARASYAR